MLNAAPNGVLYSFRVLQANPIVIETQRHCRRPAQLPTDFPLTGIKGTSLSTRIVERVNPHG